MEAIPSDVEGLYGELADTLPSQVIDTDIESFVFAKEILPQPSSIAVSDQFWMRRLGFHFYDSFPVDSIDLCADKRSCTTLGLLILATVFHAAPVTVEIELTHPASWIRRLRIRYEHDSSSMYGDGYGTVPSFFTYRPRSILRHPFTDDLAPDPRDLPLLQITTQDEMAPARGVTNDFDDEMQHRDTVILESSDRGHIRLAELLLNAGLADNQQDEFQLEVEGGFRGVAPLSAELGIWLPGSMGYDPADLR